MSFLSTWLYKIDLDLEVVWLIRYLEKRELNLRLIISSARWMKSLEYIGIGAQTIGMNIEQSTNLPPII